MSRDWTLYLEDIAGACRLIEQCNAGMSGESFAASALVFHDTVRNLEIVGEAAKRLLDEAKARMPEVDWAGADPYAACTSSTISSLGTGLAHTGCPREVL